jgi:hypothetical protein
VLALCGLNTYYCNRVIDQVQVTERDRLLVAGAIPAIQHFQMLAEEAMKALVKEQARVRALEGLLFGEPLPAPPAAEKRNEDEVI